MDTVRPTRQAQRAPTRATTLPSARPPARGPLRTGPSRRNPVPALVALALVPALLLWVVFRWADGRAEAAAGTEPATDAPAASTPESARLATGVLSFRRTSGELSRRLNMAAFQQGAQPLMDAVGEGSCAAISLNGTMVGSKAPDTVVIPASNMKNLVAAVAADVLGTDFTYTTSVVGPAPSGGVVQGDVHLVGGGDPLLSSDWYAASGMERMPVFNATSLDELAQRVAAAGVTTIQGSVLGDGSRYDDEFYVDTWGPDVAGIEAGPYDALMANDARVLGEDQRAGEPNEAAAREFVRLLGERGVAVTGSAGVGTAPAGAAELASIESQPLTAVLAEMLTNSDNNTAELVLKELGYQQSQQGTREAGAAVVTAALQSWGVSTAGLVIGDGSGLSLDNRVSCTTMLQVLQHAGFDGPVGQGLAIGGQTGTLSDAFADTTVAGRIRGKTGTLMNLPFDQDPPAVKALSGYLPVEGGEAIEYVLILNGGMITEQSEYRPIWAELVTALTSYPAVVSPAELGPR
jgi:D-alanyl-D-alanine carboxypeptidase/D-alanyl-D-alanine-endopeptidase (penicillin-binding protein 4)